MNITVEEQPVVAVEITNETSVIEIVLQQGPAGQAGAPNTLSIGSVVTGDADAPAAATIEGEAPNQILNLVIPRGASGIPNGDPVSGGTY